MAKKHNDLKLIPKKYGIIFFTAAFIIIIAGAAFTAAQIIDGIIGLRQAPVAFECTDSDNGTVLEEFGSCADSNRQTQYDTCVFTGLKEPLKLREWHCSPFCNFSITSCPPDTICAGGECVQL